MTIWYAIRTEPGAQMPQREYAVETTRSKKGYRIVPSLNADISAVERSLKDAGFVYYMPVEKRLVRDRRKTNHWTTRRFPLLQGWMFVADVVDFKALEATPGVLEYVRNDGHAYRVSEDDIAFLRDAEAAYEAKIEQEMARRLAASATVTRSKARRLFPKGSRIRVVEGPIEGMEAEVIGMDREGRIKALIDTLHSLGPISIPCEAVRMVA